MVILVDRPNTSIRHNSPLEINRGQISALFLTAFLLKKPGFCDREWVLECTENIRLLSQEYTIRITTETLYSIVTTLLCEALGYCGYSIINTAIEQNQKD